MNWITKLERKYGRFCIPNLINILIGGQILVYAIELFVNQYISFYLSLSRSALFAGQIWRLFTFVLVPFSGGGPAQRGAGHLFYLVRRQCAGTGVGRFPLQPLCPVGDGRRVAGLPADRLCRYLLPVPLPPAGLCHALPGAAGAALLRHPLKVKYFGIFAAALWVFSFLSMGMLGKLNYLLCMLGFLLFFGPQAWHNIRAWVRREQWKRKNRR